MRPAKSVDALRVVPHDQHVAVLRPHRVDDLALQPVGVLVLVDQHRRKPFLQRLARERVIDQQPFPVEQQIIEIHRVHLRLPLGEPARHAKNLVFERDELGRLGNDHVRQRPLRVDRARIEIDERVRPRKAALADAVAEVGGGAGHHFFRVLAIEQPESIGVPEPRRVVPQEPVRDVVEGAG